MRRLLCRAVPRPSGSPGPGGQMAALGASVLNYLPDYNEGGHCLAALRGGPPLQTRALLPRCTL
jgi:hypothetical protein